MTSTSITTIVFDLDGTLYCSEPFAAAIQDAGRDYMANLLKLSPADAEILLKQTRSRLQKERGTEQTLSTICAELGGTVPELHAWFISHLRPELFLQRDQRVIELLKNLAARYQLFLYTNNNRTLTTRILAILGFDNCFCRIYTIDDTWQAKPDDDTITGILAAANAPPEQVLFVGDRYDIDLRLPEARGCPVYLARQVEQLLKLESVLAR